ncbi:MAG: phospho-sugar mutase [Clostridia bacterium]|nr:phospho-sugar mutase [Clostridia bacterium]
MLNYKNEYERWLNSEFVDEETKKELIAIKDDENEIRERFYCDLEFGTAGLRGIIAAGTNRMNVYTVRRATQGLALYIKNSGQEAMDKGVAIAYDSRLYSDKFAFEAASVLAANGIKAYVFDELRPTPELSFAVRHLGCFAGIIITASHNPAIYNGYKVYGEDGAQMAPVDADKVLSFINQTDVLGGAKTVKESDLITVIGEEVDKEYLKNVAAQAISVDAVKEAADSFNVIYTPLHGAGNKLVRRVLDMMGFKNVHVVKEQELPDPEFSTVKSPNPENPEVFVYAEKLAREKGANLIIGTDPDSDRVGIMVLNKEGVFVPFTGNQVGALLVEYILSRRSEINTLPKDPVVIKTIVTTNLAADICKSYGFEIRNVLTGFKFIGEIIKNLESKGEESRYVLGFEESYGYLAGTYARDKDAVVATMLIAEMAAYYKTKGLTLFDCMENIYKKYGYYKENQKSITLEGISGVEKIKEICSYLRENPLKEICGQQVVEICDYQTSKSVDVKNGVESEIDLPKSNVLSYITADGTKVIVRPSGTEPKIKFYFFVKGNDEKNANEKLCAVNNEILDKINKLL